MSADLLNVAQAAEVLGVGERFVRRLVNERRIRFYKIGTHVRFDRADLEAFKAASVVEALTVDQRHPRLKAVGQ